MYPFARQILGRVLPRRWQPLLTVWAVSVLAAASVNAVQTGRPGFFVLAALAVIDLSIVGVRGLRERRRHRPAYGQLQPASSTVGVIPAAVRPL